MSTQFIHTKVVGISHKNRRGPSRQTVARRCKPGRKLFLVREPDNPVDHRAIAVFARYGLLGRQRQLGYIDAELAHELARKMNHGVNVRLEIR